MIRLVSITTRKSSTTQHTFSITLNRFSDLFLGYTTSFFDFTTDSLYIAQQLLFGPIFFMQVQKGHQRFLNITLITVLYNMPKLFF